jgi:hypothetical protein
VNICGHPANGRLTKLRSGKRPKLLQFTWFGSAGVSYVSDSLIAVLIHHDPSNPRHLLPLLSVLFYLLVVAVIPVAVAVTIPRVFEALCSVYPATCPILRDQDAVEKRARGGVPVVMGRFVAVDHCHHITVRREREQRSVNNMSGDIPL